MIQVKLPDGTVKEYSEESSAMDVAESIGSRLAQAVAAAEVDGDIVDATRPLKEVSKNSNEVNLRLLTSRDAEALAVMRHSCAHIMARAVMRVYPNVGLAFGPTLANGFYYDFDMEETISEDDFPRIEAEMKKIIKESESFERFNLNRDEAVELCKELNQDLKVEHIETGLGEHDTVSFYRQGEFVDLCRGPHIPNAGLIKAFKLLSVAGSYWKGDAANKSLQRLYGTAWFSKQDLKSYLEQVEEAKRRDHRVLGRKLGLFQINPDVGQGLCLWLPKGATIRSVLEDFIKKELVERGYQPVYSPHIGRVELYETSGHFPYYRDSQFNPIFGHDAGQMVDAWIRKLQEEELSGKEETKLLEASQVLGCRLNEYNPKGSVEEKVAVLRSWEKQQERYLLKPMNCPHHVQMYKAQPRSYKELPVRLAEFGTVYRHEQSGELNGMLRVRGLTQDDAHLFCMPEQVEGEFRETIELVRFVLDSVGLDDYRVQLSLRDPNSDKYVGSEENWQQAETALRRVLTESGLEFSAEEGEAAFYGPKADFMVRDCLGREWQLGTVQLDYNLPERFQLEYIGSDNKRHRPVMIHRAPFGSMERFIGMLIEHFAGAFPLWLAPEQIRVLPLSEKTEEYAIDIAKKLQREGFRVSTDLNSAKVQAKIRDAQLDLIPYMIIVGPKEAEENGVSLRDRLEGDLGTMPFEEALARLKQEVAEKTIRQVVKSSFAGLESNEGVENEY
ncbi:Threonine--tRNA ligase [Polystyrenella longa]|uniref:Threonine--tRNA ligase n=1 Tax=Polystyrenella longa TaxID=2528007 RepID=A0A518CMG4_9PLAN|nr:threonine--tRNA ligase [Polystyrenella longa]QDU80421.1 Threonine--tRNA ligase [Polystyrenella longa]